MHVRDSTVPADMESGGWAYCFEGILGEGGFGVVYRSVRRRDGASQRVAVKVFDPLAPADALRFRDELRFLLHHPHDRFVHVYDIIAVGQSPAVVMELVEGDTLESVSGSIDAPVVADIGARVAEALIAAWEYRPDEGGTALNLLHRDLKPGNLMIAHSGEIRVLDLGAAWSAPDHREAETRRGFGRPYTPGYAAPEIGQRGPTSPAEDVFGLGATLLALRTGARFATLAGHRGALVVVAGEPLGKLLGSMLDEDPGARPTMSAARDRLSAIARSSPGQDTRSWVSGGRRTGELTIGSVGSTRNLRTLVAEESGPTKAAAVGAAVGVGVAGVALVALLGVGAVGWWWMSREPAPPLAETTNAAVGAVSGEATPEVTGNVTAARSVEGADAGTVSTGVQSASGAAGTGGGGLGTGRSAGTSSGTTGARNRDGTADVESGAVSGAGTVEAPAEPTPEAAEPPRSARVTAVVEDGCVVKANRVAVGSGIEVAAGSVAVTCEWSKESVSGGSQPVSRSVSATAAEGARVVVSCRPSMNRCAVER